MANKTISNAGGNWSANGTWVEGAPPTAAEDVIATVTSGQVTVDTAACVCKSINLTNYASVFTNNGTLTVSGSVTFISGMPDIQGTGILKFNATGTLTSGTKTYPGAVIFNTTGTYTLGDNWIVTGTVSTTAAATITLNGNQLTANGSLTVNSTLQGTTLIVLGGTGTWSSGSISGVLNNSLTINTVGTITVSGNVYYKTGTLTYIAGTMTLTAGALNITASCTYNMQGITWFGCTLQGNGTTITLQSDFTVSGLLDLTSTIATNLTFSGAHDISIGTLRFGCGAFGTRTLNIPAGQTLTINTAMYMEGTLALNTSLASLSASSTAYLHYLGTAANYRIYRGNFSNIDASGSNQTLFNYGGAVSGCVNIVPFTAPPTVAGTFS